MRIAGETCPICGGAGIATTRPDVRHCGCTGRGALLSWVWGSLGEYESLYTEDCRYHEAEQVREGQEPFYDRAYDHRVAARCRVAATLAFTKHLRVHASLMDVGCGDGAFVDAANLAGFEACGLEPNPIMARRGCAEDVDIGGWRDLQGEWDVITMHDVFEHLAAPRECLGHLGLCLKAGSGRLIIEMPEYGSRESDKAGLAWRHIRPRQHLVLYSFDAAVRLFRSCGFELAGYLQPLGGAIGKGTWCLEKS